MKTNETLKLLDDKDFLDKIYHFSYHRCNTSFEAEDLCLDIVFAVISAIHKQERIENFYAFVWTIARRVYADYCEKRNAERQVFSIENSDLMLASKENEIEEFVEEAAEQEQISRIFKEIAFLSKAYREVMVMFYIDELKVKEIATRLNINKIVIHAPDKSCGKRRQKIEIYYKAAGIINIHSDDCIAEDGRKERWQTNKSA